MVFDEIPVDRSAVPQEELNIENKTRSNLFAWTGQFSPQFVETLLRYYARENDVVVDPFAGSGTVLCEAARQGLGAYGTELNAAAYYMAKAYELANWTEGKREELIDRADKIVASITLPSEVVPALLEERETSEVPLSSLLGLLVVLLDLHNNTVTLPLLWKKWEGIKAVVREMPYSEAPIRAEMGDARKLGCGSDAATLLVTSPPYINVFNYHQKYRRSVEALGHDVLAAARKEFGSNRKNRGNRLLTVVQYCVDMALAVREAIRVCRAGARMVYVVGRESQVLGYSFCNSRLVCEVAAGVQELPVLVRQERVFRNRYGQEIYEDVLHFENRKEGLLLEEKAVEEKARLVAVEALREKMAKHPDSENIAKVAEALDRAGDVRRSEM